ncbi:hypothetical protein EV126DRAFT_226673 [Verticillium dahliae]|nr:hypothetical protein EV126DRAFT_226673 [Verticillium dahliae]
MPRSRTVNHVACNQTGSPRPRVRRRVWCCARLPWRPLHIRHGKAPSRYLIYFSGTCGMAMHLNLIGCIFNTRHGSSSDREDHPGSGSSTVSRHCGRPTTVILPTIAQGESESEDALCSSLPSSTLMSLTNRYNPAFPSEFPLDCVPHPLVPQSPHHNTETSSSMVANSCRLRHSNRAMMNDEVECCAGQAYIPLNMVCRLVHRIDNDSQGPAFAM